MLPYIESFIIPTFVRSIVFVPASDLLRFIISKKLSNKC